ncbi:unnamed protein product [Cladocopium goreaui]|uniref:Uncharacterized protein n=1 Tax=Cladocopium goreaui TaxID=2562237 RepID=A0A9P1FU98_9DINO|nr:unnamed protein product [Cladocopium goreaui]|mmetsp:Transcript_29423/g.63755  ORF Transcript_29423/g.63755 Transcript_29423/m.63755 type:complete len:195 (-) Transcript_29423:147-731(-)
MAQLQWHGPATWSMARCARWFGIMAFALVVLGLVANSQVPFETDLNAPKANPAWLEMVRNQTERSGRSGSCGPSFCFSSGSQNCFQNHRAPVCLKAIYFCIEYVMTGPAEPQLCRRETDAADAPAGPWNRLIDVSSLPQMPSLLIAGLVAGLVALGALLMVKPFYVCMRSQVPEVQHPLLQSRDEFEDRLVTIV